MAYQSIGDLTFYRNPYTMTIPETKKTVAEVPTYGGSAIFQWGAILEGSVVVLKWKWMTVSDYNDLRTKYLTTDQYIWNPDLGGTTYNVIITDLKGAYFEAALDKVAYRDKVECRLNIRSEV